MKKLLSIALAGAMLACMLPMAVSAATEVPIAKKADGTALSGDIVEAHLKSFTINENELSLGDCDQGYFIFDDEMQVGRLEGTIVTNAQSGSCSGIVFGLTDVDNDLNFWEGMDSGDVSFYWLMIDENNNVRLARVGANADYSNNPKNVWKDMISNSDWVDLDNKEIDVTKGVTIAAEWDGNGNIKCYANDELIYDVTDSTPYTGSLYGVRMKAKSQSGAYFTSIVAGVAEENNDNQDNNDNNQDETPPKTGDMTTLAISVATLALIGTAVIVSKKRRFN